MCGFSIVGSERVVHHAATVANTVESHSILKAFGGVYAHHGVCQSGMQLVKHGFAESCRHSFDHTGHRAAYGVAFASHLVDEVVHPCRRFGVGAAHGVGFHQRWVVFAVVGVEADVAHLRSVGVDGDAELIQCLASECSGNDTGNSLARARASAAAMVAQPVFSVYV